MTDRTHCDRCNAHGPHKDDQDRTPAFPATAKITAFEGLDDTPRTYDICAECAAELAAWLGDDRMGVRVRAVDEDADG